MPETLRNATEPMPYERIAVKRMAGALGAEIEGVDLARLDDATFAEIYRAFLEHQVIFFRGQDIAPEQYLAFAKRWGGIHFYPYMKGLDSHPEIFELVKTVEQKAEDRKRRIEAAEAKELAKSGSAAAAKKKGKDSEEDEAEGEEVPRKKGASKGRAKVAAGGGKGGAGKGKKAAGGGGKAPSKAGRTKRGGE